MAYLHKVATTENETERVEVIDVASGIQVAVGIAPVHMAEDPGAYVNIPVACYKKDEVKAAIGYSSDLKGYGLNQVAKLNFEIFGVAPVVFINVLDPKKHKKDFDETVVEVEAGVAALKMGGVLLGEMVVKKGDEELENGRDYMASHNDDDTVSITLLSSGNASNATELKVKGTVVDPSMVTEEDIIGGYDSETGKFSGIEAVRMVYPRLGLVPGTLLAPGWSKETEVAAVLTAKAQLINGCYNAMAAIDMDTETTRVYTELEEAKEELGIEDPRAVLLWPKWRRDGELYDFSAVWAAVAAYTDGQNDGIPYKYVSNIAANMTAAVLEDETEVLLDTDMAGEINGYGIVTAVNDSGWRIWGNNTSAYPTVTRNKDRWIACRRMMNWLRNHLVQTYREKVDNILDARLRDAVVDAENSYLASLTGSGIIAGGEVTYAKSKNSDEAVLNGHIVFDMRVAFWTPGEYLQFDVEFDPTFITEAMATE